MDLQTMRTEVQARGFSHVTTALIDRWINLTYQDTNNRFPWPFLETNTSGTPPITIADFGHAISVVNLTDGLPLTQRDIRLLQDIDPALSLSGKSRHWYRDGADSNKIKVWPTGAGTVQVRYIKVAADLGTDVSVPLSPLAFHYLYVEGACMRCYRRANEGEAAADCANEIEVGIAKMAEQLLPPILEPRIPEHPAAATSPEDQQPPEA